MRKQREYLNKKFLEWQSMLGEPQSQKAWAAYLTMPPTTYSNYYNTDAKPRGKYLQRMVDLWGKEEVYEAFDIDPEEVEDPLDAFPPKIRDAVREIRESLVKYNISGESPEAERLATEILIKHGFKVNDPENSESAK